MSIRQPDRYELAYAMQERGTPFVKALSKCVVLGTEDSIERLAKAFPDIWRKYSLIASQTKGGREG